MTLYIEKRLSFSIRLHRMHEMQSILTDVRGVSVCLSVTRLISASVSKSGWTDQDAIRSEHSRGPWSPHREEEGTQFYILGPVIPGTAEATDLEFCMRTGRCAPQRKLCNSRSYENRRLGHVTLLLTSTITLGTAIITPGLACRSSMIYTPDVEKE